MTFSVLMPLLPHDVVLALPFLYRLAETYTETWVDVIVAGAYRDILETALNEGLAPYSNRVRLRPDAYTDEWDAAFLLDRSLRAGFRVWCSGTRERVGFASGAPSFLYTRAVLTKWNEAHPEIERNLDLLRAQSDRRVAPWSNDAPSLLRAPVDFVGSPPDPVVVVTLPTSSQDRAWVGQSLAQFCDRVTAQGVEVWLTGDAAAAPLAHEVQKLAPSLLVKNECRDRNLHQTLALLSRAQVVVSGDLLVIHLASDLRVPVVALVGDKVPDLGYAPWRKQASAIGISRRHCLACEREGLKHRKHGSHTCLTGMSGDRVYRETRRWIDSLP